MVSPFLRFHWWLWSPWDWWRWADHCGTGKYLECLDKEVLNYYKTPHLNLRMVFPFPKWVQGFEESRGDHYSIIPSYIFIFQILVLTVTVLSFPFSLSGPRNSKYQFQRHIWKPSPQKMTHRPRWDLWCSQHFWVSAEGILHLNAVEGFWWGTSTKARGNPVRMTWMI